MKDLEKIIPPTIGEYNLIANASKWDRTTLTSTINEGKDQANWRLTKKLGSLLGDKEDVERRRSLARESFKSLRMLWDRTGVTSIETRVRAYNALVLPVMLYNCGTWGLTESILNILEVQHRDFLRDIIGVKVAVDIHNVELYNKCNMKPLKLRIVRARWSLFGHILRLSRDTPAQLAMDYYGQLEKGEKEPRGRPDTTLPVLLFNEYRKYKEVKKERGWSVVKSKADTLAELRILAADRQKWRKLVNFICGEEFDEESACFD